MANKFLPHNVQVNETKFYNRHAISMLPTMPVPVETIQSAEITSPTSAQNSSNNSNVVVGSNPCAVPIATLSIRDLRLRGYSFLRSHASKHGLPNASRKQMREVIELLKSHYEVVHQVSMLKDDFEYGTFGYGARGGKVANLKNSSPTMLPQGAMSFNNIKTDFNQINEKSIQNALMSLVPFQIKMPPDQAPVVRKVESIMGGPLEDKRVPMMQQTQQCRHQLYLLLLLPSWVT